MYQWLKSGSLKRPISDIEEDNTVNDMNEVQVNNSYIYLSKQLSIYKPVLRCVHTYCVNCILYISCSVPINLVAQTQIAVSQARKVP